MYTKSTAHIRKCFFIRIVTLQYHIFEQLKPEEKNSITCRRMESLLMMKNTQTVEQSLPRWPARNSGVGPVQGGHPPHGLPVDPYESSQYKVAILTRPVDVHDGPVQKNDSLSISCLTILGSRRRSSTITNYEC